MIDAVVGGPHGVDTCVGALVAPRANDGAHAHANHCLIIRLRTMLGFLPFLGNAMNEL